MTKPRVLLVDDEANLVEMVKFRLEINGYEVLTASDGQEGLDRARVEKPNVVILDVMLPKLNGYEVCALLKQDARYRSIPITLFTAKAQERDEKLGMECGADAYIRKPFRSEDLLETLHRLLESSRQRKAS